MVFCRAREMPRLWTQPLFFASEYLNVMCVGIVVLGYQLFLIPWLCDARGSMPAPGEHADRVASQVFYMLSVVNNVK